MKAIKILAICAIALTALAACSKEEDDVTPDVPSSNGVSAVTSESSLFTAGSDGGSILFAAKGGYVVLNVTSDSDWDVVEDGADWLSLGYGGSSVTVTATQSTVQSERTATLTFTSAGASFATVHITQEAYTAPELGVDGLSWHAPAVGELTTVIAVEANYDWEPVSSAEWLGAEKTDGGLRLTAGENSEYEERTAEVKVTCTDGVSADTQIVSVLQDARAFVSLAQTEIVADTYGATFTVEVESNFETACSCDASWITAGLSGDVLTLTVESNQAEDAREATVTVTCGDGAENVAEASLTVSQEANNLSAMVLEYTLTASAQVILPINTDVRCRIDWGDGSSIQSLVSDFPSHTYSAGGTYRVTVSGSASSMNMFGAYGMTAGPELLTAVVQWGDLGLTSMDYAFYNAGLTSIPADTEGSFAGIATFYKAFYQCADLSQISADLFKYASAATSFEYCFAGCTSLTEIPDGLFDACTAVTTFAYAFDGCSSLKDLPEGVFAGKDDLTSVSYMFRDCSAITSIPSGYLDDLAGLTKIDYLFYGCSGVRSIPTGLLDKCTSATSMQYLFAGTGITSIPSGLFDNNTKVSILTGIFFNTNITTIPSGLFDNNTSLNTFNYMFYGCSRLKTVPEGLFANCGNATNFKYTFMNCTSLTEVPDDLFLYNTKAADFTSVFQGSGLTKVPNLFANCSAATEFYGAFWGCSSLTSDGIPADLFSGATAATRFEFLFAYCTSLETVPAGLFDHNTALKNAGGIFYYCTSLTSVPEGLFDKNVNVTSFGSLFIGCTSLTGVPTALFDHNTAVTTFYGVFSGCTNLTGESPYTEVDGTKVHLYQRENYPDDFATPKSYSGCFTGCNKLSDYSSIPSAWR